MFEVHQLTYKMQYKQTIKLILAVNFSKIKKDTNYLNL